MTKQFNINLAYSGFGIDDVLSASSSGSLALITEKLIRGDKVTYRVYPYNPPKNRFKKFFYLLWIKIKLHYTI